MTKIYIMQKVSYTSSKNWNWTGYTVGITCIDGDRDYQFTEYYSEKFGAFERVRRQLEEMGNKVYTLKECYPLPEMKVRDWRKLSDMDLIAVNTDGTITNGDKIINNKG